MSNADTPKASDAAAKVERVVPALHPRFFQNAEHARTVYCATIPAGVEVEELKTPSFWAHIAAKLRPWDAIEAIAEDGRYFAELRVLSATQTDALVVVIHAFKLQAALPGETDLLKNFTVSHTPATNWRVLRKSDKQEVATNLKSREEAITWIATNQRAAA